MTLGERLRLLRTRRRWSQRELAERAGVRQALISQLESGKQADTTGANLRKLAFALGCTVDYLTGYNGPADPDGTPERARSVEGAALSLALTHTEGR
jgi:transcriptional regulator with XRE-family HTH domain